MLYDRWREIARDFRNEIALRDLETGRHWTFAELDSLVATAPREPVFPQGSAADFIAATLGGWRSGAVVCPLEPGQQRPEFPRPSPSIAHVKITSASTGPARFVAFTAAQLAADARNIIETMGLRRDWPNLGVISLAHSYGFSNLVTPLLLHGIPLVVTGSPLPGAVGAALKKIGAATLPGVPALWRAWIDADVLSASTVRLAISAGAPLPVPLEGEIFERSGIKLHNFYGSTECGGIAFDSSDKPRHDPGYAGRPLKHVELSIASDGCLEVRGDAVGETYWPAPGELLRRGCFRTTDVAEIIDAGVYLRGRASDVINIAGRKIAPESIENSLLRHPLVRQCIVFGVPESDRDRIVACVAADASASAEQLRQFLLDHLPAWQVPREFWIVRELPVDQRGKTSRGALRAHYQKIRA